MKHLLFSLLLLVLASCSPLKSSPREEKHQLELTLHELRTHLDDQRHDLNCFQTELQILDGRIKYYEQALMNLKQQELEKQHSSIVQLSGQLQSLEKTMSVFERAQNGNVQDLKQLTGHANEMTAALSQFKQRILELEQQLQSHHARFDELAKLKTSQQPASKQLSSQDGLVYKVRPGDSLEKIARLHKTTAERIKKSNHLESDLIVVGQELCIPPS